MLIFTFIIFLRISGSNTRNHLFIADYFSGKNNKGLFFKEEPVQCFLKRNQWIVKPSFYTNQPQVILRLFILF